jgi:hypothetical protein
VQLFIIAILGILIDGTTWFFFRSVPFMFWLEVVLLFALLVALVPKLLYAIALRQPMLLLTPSFLTYRKARIPWNVIDEVTELETPSGPHVGIVLNRSIISTMPLELHGVPWITVAPLLRKELAQYGAICVPPARAMTVQELQLEITAYRAGVLATYEN